MIPVRDSEMILIPMLFHLVIVFLCGLYYFVKDRPEKKPAGKTRAYYCRACGHIYGDERNVPVAPCPRCATMNEAVKM
jgi:hypothetical protein